MLTLFVRNIRWRLVEWWRYTPPLVMPASVVLRLQARP